MSSSSDSEDENIALLKQAVDTNFISDGMFSSVLSSENGNNSTESQKTTQNQNEEPQKPTATSLKSQRNIDHDEIEADLKVPKSMQDFVYKKMSKKIEDSVEFVEVKLKKKKKRDQSDDDTNCVRLLSDTDPITKIDLISEEYSKPMKHKKLELKRRVIEPDSYSDEKKIELAAIDGETILKQIETKCWKSKKSKSNKVFQYRQNKSVLHFIEPENEFSLLRKKNNWNESKIANSPWRQHN